MPTLPRHGHDYARTEQQPEHHKRKRSGTEAGKEAGRWSGHGACEQQRDPRDRDASREHDHRAENRVTP